MCGGSNRISFVAGGIFSSIVAILMTLSDENKVISIQNEDLKGNAKAYEVVDSSDLNYLKKDTLIVIPLNASRQFQKSAYRAINNKQIMIVNSKSPGF